MPNATRQLKRYRAGGSDVPNPPTKKWVDEELRLLKTLLDNIIVAARADLGIVKSIKEGGGPKTTSVPYG